jgi:hypothetical protein
MASRSMGDLIIEMMLVLLRPGIAAICSSECFKCSTHGHRAAQCALVDNHPARLSQEEACWRMICGSVLGLINKATMMEVYLTFDRQGNMQPEWEAEEQELDQGKEKGSPM